MKVHLQQQQPGSIFPAFIGRIEENGIITGWTLTLDGHSKTYPTYDAAYETARNLLTYPQARKQWPTVRESAARLSVATYHREVAA